MMDVFSGCGGMTLGFHRAGFRCVSAVEADPAARLSHELNFANLVGTGQYKAYDDITKLSSSAAVKHLTGGGIKPHDAIDVLIGGPPCQAFSRLGRAALWRIKGKRHSHTDDPRASLYEHFLAYVEDLKPIAFVLENVPDMGRFHGTNIAEEIALAAEDLGYETRYTLLNAAWYGVPQFRERLFIVGVRKELDLIPTFPVKTHRWDLPKGYATSRAGSFAGSRKSPVVGLSRHYVDHTVKAKRTRPSPTVRLAFEDLPVISNQRNVRLHRRAPTVSQLERERKYRSAARSYSRVMREWPGFYANGSCSGNVIRCTPRDYQLFAKMKPGDRYPDAVRIAERIFARRLRQAEKIKGSSVRHGTVAWKRLRATIVPPYAVTRFPDKFRKLDPDAPSATVPAHLGKDCYSHIHPSIAQARTITIREAARLQSFPDGFRLKGNMGQRFTQIGNAVPPLLAFALGRHLKSMLDEPRRSKRGQS